jgi:hypothetical protein
MEPKMRSLTLALVAAFALAVPAAAQSLSVLLPQISYPEPVNAPSTKSCVAAEAAVCQLSE